MPVDTALALALLPDFALILLGASLRRLLPLGDHFWSGLERLVYYCLFPPLRLWVKVTFISCWLTAASLSAKAMVNTLDALGASVNGAVLGAAAVTVKAPSSARVSV